MEQLIAGGAIADLILAVLAAEAILLAWRDRAAGGGRPGQGGQRARGDALRRCAPALAAGACLAAALRAALTGAGWEWIAAALAGALVAHLADLKSRLSGSAPVPARPPTGETTMPSH